MHGVPRARKNFEAGFGNSAFDCAGHRELGDLILIAPVQRERNV